MYNYGFRFYDPAIGRFTSVDPISVQFPHVSTYNYAENSPIGNIDLWGLQRVGADTALKIRIAEQMPGDIVKNYKEFSNFEHGPPVDLTNEDFQMIGKAMSSTGDVIALVGYSISLLGGVGAPVAAIGESIALTGKVIENIAKFTDGDVSNEDFEDAAIDFGSEVAPFGIGKIVKKSKMTTRVKQSDGTFKSLNDDFGKEIIQNTTNKVGKVMEFGIERKVQQDRKTKKIQKHDDK